MFSEVSSSEKHVPFRLEQRQFEGSKGYEYVLGVARGPIREHVSNKTSCGVNQSTFQRDRILLHGMNGGIWDGGLSFHQDWSNVDFLPLDWNLRARCLS
jgi:hypothetical protein